MIMEQSQFDLEGLVSNDDLFQDDPVLAYASAWLISFHLSEKFPIANHVSKNSLSANHLSGATR